MLNWKKIQMTTILPKGEKVKQAIKWISEERQENKGGDLFKLINDASMKFDLSPNEGDFLITFFCNAKKDQNPADLLKEEDGNTE
jgi:hypothetical protein